MEMTRKHRQCTKTKSSSTLKRWERTLLIAENEPDLVNYHKSAVEPPLRH